MKYAIDAQKLTKKFKNNIAVNGINLRVAEGSIYGFLGPNGAGKTSLMRTLIGALPALGGSIRWGGRVLAGMTDRERASMMAFAAPRPVDESAFTVEHLTLLGRVAARGVWNSATADDHERAAEALALLGQLALDVIRRKDGLQVHPLLLAVEPLVQRLGQQHELLLPRLHVGPDVVTKPGAQDGGDGDQ